MTTENETETTNAAEAADATLEKVLDDVLNTAMQKLLNQATAQRAEHIGLRSAVRIAHKLAHAGEHALTTEVLCFAAGMLAGRRPTNEEAADLQARVTAKIIELDAVDPQCEAN